MGWRVTIHHQGTEREPVIVIDDFAADPDQLIDEAATRSFARTMPYYPGIRAGIDARYHENLQRDLADLLADIFDYGNGIHVEGCCFSLVTTRPADLTPIQRLPHYDGCDGTKLAVLHYLSGPEQGGTAFYHHRATGFETVREDRFAAYKQALEADIARVGLPQQDYLRADNALFEQIASYDAAFNRVLIYRGVTLHSGMIPAACAFSEDPRKGRLTVNTFLAPA